MAERKYVNRGRARFCSKSCKSTGRFADPLRYKDGKSCTKCGTLKPVSEFSSSIHQGRSRPNSWCKSCLNGHNTEKYRSNPTIRTRTKEARKAIRFRTREFFIGLLQQSSCMDCGETDIIVLDFDHRDQKTKKFNLAEAVSGGISMARIKAEIEKCDIVCANCHRRRTAKQFGHYRSRVAPKGGIEPPTQGFSDLRSTD